MPPKIRALVPLVGAEKGGRVNGAECVQRGGQNHPQAAAVPSGIQNMHGGAQCCLL